MIRRFLLVLLGVAVLSAPVYCAPNAFGALVDEYFNDYFQRNPTAATADGFHQHDAELEDFSQAAVADRVKALHGFEGKFAAVETSTLSPLERADLRLVQNDIKSQLLELENIRMWEKNPDRYSSHISESAFVLMSRKFAPPAERLRSVIAREKQMPALLQTARANLVNPPRIYTEVALEQLPGIISFFEKDVAAAFKGAVNDEFRASNQAVIEALRQYQGFLKDDLLPRSHGDFRIGTENFRKKLLYDDMVDIPLDRLLQVGYANLRENQRRFKQVAAELNRRQSPRQVLLTLGHDHPPATRLLASFRDVLGGLRKFIERHAIVTIPSPVPPILEETPPFERALTFASMDTPGPYEKIAKEAYFNVTLPEAVWPQPQVEEFMQGFNYGTIISTAVHEAYPGHYVQFLWVQHAPSKVRKLIGCSTNAEGWAHYCEQMMLDQGYGNGSLKLRLGQLQDALLRNARYVVGLKMHSGQMTFEQGVDFFVREGYQTRANGLRETKRGTSDPTYLYYTLGKLEILKLREDYKRMRGGRFVLREFHDRFLAQGFPPIAVIREAMLGRRGSVL